VETALHFQQPQNLSTFAPAVMEQLHLLFTRDALQYQSRRGRQVTSEESFAGEENTPSLLVQLEQLLTSKKYSHIQVISALNHFTMMPEGFREHELGYELIAYNAPVVKEQEELMLSVNKKYGVQFYYTLPKNVYQLIKQTGTGTAFNFSGEQFLSRINPKNRKEIHINLYAQQCEFFALDGRKVVLYNNLDVSSEVDFLYFIMFTLSKIGFGSQETSFFVYGETTENETFISELRKFVKKLKISFDNIPNRHFLLNTK